MDSIEKKPAREVLEWALSQYHPDIAFASSFGAEDVVLIDMIAKINPSTKIFSLDTGRLPEETYDVIERLRDRYGLRFDMRFPREKRVEEMLRLHGPNLFYKNRDLRKMCCDVRKVEPLNDALSGLRAWISGLRREQAVTRGALKKVEIDASHDSIVKVNPLADWSTQQVWDYIKLHGVPYNALHDRGYPSIGCAPCTRAVAPGEDLRAGRWWWENPEEKECGLHPTAADAGKRI